MLKKLKPVVSSEDGILTKLFRKILMETGYINSIQFFINRYIKSGGKKNKATIGKIIIDGEMTWKSFMFLVFEILPIKKMKIKITLFHQSGEETEHEIEIVPTMKTVKKDKDE